MTAESAEKEGERGLERVWDNAGEAPPERDPRVDFAAVKLTPNTKFNAPTDPLADLNRGQKRLVRSMAKRSRQDLANLPALRWIYPGLIQALGIIFFVGCSKEPQDLHRVVACRMCSCRSALRGS